MKDKKKVEYYQLLTEGEIAEETGLKNIVTAEALLYDIKYLIKSQYIGCFNVNGNVLEVAFSNGDALAIRIKEQKSEEKESEFIHIGNFRKNDIFDKKSFLEDLRFLLNDFYPLTFAADEKTLLLQFNNGQKFSVSVDEIAKIRK